MRAAQPRIPQDELTRLRRYRETRCPRLKESLVTEYYWIVELVARRYQGRGEPRDDIEQVASLGLVAALERYDPDTGRPFPSFAIPTALGEVRRHFRDRTWRVRVPRGVKDLALEVTAVTEELVGDLDRLPTEREIADRLGVSLRAVGEARAAASANHPLPVAGGSGSDEDEATVTPGELDDPLEDTGTRILVEELLGLLPERDRAIVHLRYFEGLSQEKIASLVGMSQPHVSRRLRTSLAAMRRHLESA